MAAGEGFGDHPRTDADAEVTAEDLPPFWLAISPAVMVIALNALFTYASSRRWTPAFLAQEEYGEATIDDVRGIWAIISALVLSIIYLIAINYRRLADLKESVNKGTFGSLLPIFNTASEVGYGVVIASLPAFTVVRDAVLGISANPLISVAVATNVLAGITGSASGGMSIALQTLGDEFNRMAAETGIARSSCTGSLPSPRAASTRCPTTGRSSRCSRSAG
jgi:H+/gluconate symporter-like permease